MSVATIEQGQETRISPFGIEEEYQYIYHLGIAAVASQWGTEQVNDRIAHNGFSKLRQGPYGIAPHDLEAQAIHVGANVLTKAIGLKGWQPCEVDLVSYGSGTPVTPNSGWTLAEAAGLTHLDPERDTFNSIMACNAGVEALVRALRGKKGKTVVIAHDRVGSVATSRDQIDPLSQDMFSNGAVALAFDRQSLSLVMDSGELIVVPDTEPALAAIETYREWFDRPSDGIYTRKGNTEVIFLPPPPHGKVIDMKGLAATKFFARIVGEHLPPFLKKYNELFPYRPIDVWVGHQASRRVVDLINKQMGITIPWLSLPGNSSAATTLTAFAQQLKDMHRGTRVGVVSYGAGASATFAVMDVGEPDLI